MFRNSAVFALAATMALAPQATPCTQPCVPGSSKQVVIYFPQIVDLGNDQWLVPIRILGYKTAGGSPGEYCTCGLGGAFNDVTDVLEFGVYYAGTTTLLPGFDAFAANALATTEWEAVSGTSGGWQAFLAPVFADIADGTLVDLEFRVIIDVEPLFPYITPVGPQLPMPGQANPNTNTGCLGDNCVDRVPLEQITAILQEELAGATIGTDAATSTGSLLDMHQALEGLGSVEVQMEVAFTYLGGGVDGASGELSLAGEGQLGAGDDGALHLGGALPTSSAFLVLGVSQLNARLKGGVLVPNPDIVLDLFTSSEGSIELPWADLPDFGTAFDVFAQVWQPDGAAVKNFAASNGLAMHIP